MCDDPIHEWANTTLIVYKSTQASNSLRHIMQVTDCSFCILNFSYIIKTTISMLYDLHYICIYIVQKGTTHRCTSAPEKFYE